MAAAQEFVVGGDGGQGPGVFGQVRDDLVRVGGASWWQVHDRPPPGRADWGGCVAGGMAAGFDGDDVGADRTNGQG